MKNIKTLSRKELYDLVWSKPMINLSKEFSLSDKGLAKKCVKHNIPRPPVGYWNKVEHGQKPKQARLPDNKDPALEVVKFYFDDRAQISPEAEPENTENIARAIAFQFPEKVKRYHDIIRDHRKVIKSGYVDQYGRMHLGQQTSPLSLKVTRVTHARACRFLQGLIDLFSSCGWSFGLSENSDRRRNQAVFSSGEEELTFEFIERAKRVKRTKSDKERGYGAWQDYDFSPTGVLEFQIENLWSPGFQIAWKDTKKAKLEDQLVSIVQGFERGFQLVKVRSIESAQRAREREECERIRKQEMRLQKIEEGRRQYLTEIVQAYHQAQDIRALIDGIKQKNNSSESLDEWYCWALGVATELDVTDNPEVILRKHEALQAEVNQKPDWAF